MDYGVCVCVCVCDFINGSLIEHWTKIHDYF